MKARLRSWLSRNQICLFAVVLLSSAWWHLRHRLGRVDSDFGSTHSRYPVTQSIAYIEEVFNDYKRYGGVERFSGTAAELGPGDSAGTALLMRGDGCQSVDLIDLVRSVRDEKSQAAIYRELSARNDLDRFRVGPEWNGWSLDGVTWHIGEGAERFFHRRAHEGGTPYDFIVSRAVFEYLRDPLSCLSDMITCLGPAGKMIHKIDLRDHRLMSPWNGELSWLEVPGCAYRLMATHPKLANRVLLHEYRRLLDRLQAEGVIRFHVFATRLVGLGEVRPHRPLDDLDAEALQTAIDVVDGHRPKFAEEFRRANAPDLAVNGIFLVVERLAPA